MTQERLRELLRERVADVTMPDYSSRAWQAARVVRRRRRLGAAAGVVAATVGISGAIAAIDSTPGARRETPVAPVPQVTEPDAAYQGVPVWWSPDQFEEHELALVESPLPAEIELRKRWNGWRDDPMDRAFAVFQQGRSMTLIGPDDALRYVPTTQLDKVTKPNGYSYFPPPTLTEDGTRVVFAQPDDRVAIYYLGERTWTYDETYDAPADRPPDPGFDTGDAQQYGPVVDGAASWGMGVPLPVRDGGYLTKPEFLATPQGVLAFMDRFSNGQDNRFKECCAVAGWLDSDTVVYESRQVAGLIVAWRVGTHDFGLVSRINGQYGAASFAL